MYQTASLTSGNRGRSSRIKQVWSLLLLLAALLFSHASLAESCGGDGGDSDPCAKADAGSNQSSTPDSNSQNPIDVITGNKYEREIDHQPRQGSLRSDLAFVRHYNSLNHQINRSLGPGWSSTWHLYLGVSSDAERQILQSDGRRIVFQQTADEGDRQRYDAVNPGDGYLQQINGRYHWHLPDGRELSFNGKGRLSAIDHPGGQRQALHYQDDRLARVEDKQGRQLTFSYYEQPGLRRYEPETSTQPAGQIEETQAAVGLLKSVGLPDGKIIQYRYDGLGNLKQATYPDGRIRNYHYDNDAYPHALTGISDAGNKRLATWGYDNEGRANHYHKPGDVDRIDLTYTPPSEADGIGATELTNSLGQKSSYRWQHQIHDAQSLLLESEGPGCSHCPEANVRYEYTGKNQIQAVHRESGTTRYEYDDQGRTTELRVTYADGTQQALQYSYEGNSHKPSTIIRPSINPDGEHRVEISYNPEQKPTAITERGYTTAEDGGFAHIERTTELSYTDGNLTAIDGPREDVKDLINLSYDAQQRLKTLTGPDGRPLTVQGYDNYGRPIEIQSGSQSPIQIEYTAQGKVAKVTQANQSVSYTYTESGQLKSLTGPDGETLTIDYDEAERVIGLTGPDGHQVQDSLDSEGRMTERQLIGLNGQLIQSLSHLYDAQGRLQSTRRNGRPDKEYDYDESGRLTEITDDQGNNTRIDYGPLGQLQSIFAADQTQLRLHYDEKGQAIGLTDPRENTTEQLKDDFGNIVRQTNPDTGTVFYEYDQAGNRTQKRDAEGRITSFGYDAANRLIEEENEEGTTTLSYDAQTGGLSRIESPTTTENFEYNEEGQLTVHTRVIDDHEFTTEYAYNPDNKKLLQKTLPDGRVLNYHYYEEGSQQGKLRAITQQTFFGLGQETLIGEVDHDKRDGKTGHTYGNGIRTEHHFDDKGQLINITNSQALELIYTYDDSGQITGIDLDGQVQSYLYDDYGRLISADTLSGQYRYAYDSLGNRTEKQHTGTDGRTRTETYGYPEPGEGNRLLSRTVEATEHSNTSTSPLTKGDTGGFAQTANQQTLAYNEAGSPTQTNDLSYEYDANQRPVKVYKTEPKSQQKQLISEYSYNRFGERIEKVIYNNTKKPKVTYYLYDGHTLTAEADEKGNITAQYLYLKGHQPVAKLEQDEIYAIHSDHLGTPRLATNEEGQTVWQADYSPFGQAEIKTQQITLNLRLPGQYEDTETGTYYNYLRDYNPDTGRYQTSDPIGLKGGMNTYAYVSGNPIQHFDPLGLLEDKDTIEVNGVQKPVADAEYMERLEWVLLEAARTAGSDVANMLTQMAQPESLLSMALMMGAITALQTVPGLNAVVDVVLLGWAWWEFGKSGVNFIVTLIEVGVGIARATDRCDLSKLATDLGHATATLGTTALDIVSGGSSRVNRIATKNNIETNVVPRNSTKADLLPPNYTRSGDNIIGPRGGVYTYTGKDAGGHRVYKNNDVYYTFKDGKKDKVVKPRDVDTFVTGLIGEQRVTRTLEDKGWEPLGATQRSGQSVDDALPGYRGSQGIDGIYKRTNADGTTEYIVVETKASQGSSTGSLNTSNDGTQLSKNWIKKRVERQVDEGTLSQADADKILAANRSGTLTTVKADVKQVRQGDQNSGTVSFTTVNQSGDKGVTPSDGWSPD